MNNFMKNRYTIQDATDSNKGRLAWVDGSIRHRRKAAGKQFGRQLEDHIDKCNGSELKDRICPVTFEISERTLMLRRLISIRPRQKSLIGPKT